MLLTTCSYRQEAKISSPSGSICSRITTIGNIKPRLSKSALNVAHWLMTLATVLCLECNSQAYMEYSEGYSLQWLCVVKVVCGLQTCM